MGLLDSYQNNFHVSVDTFVSNFRCDSALTQDVVERTVGFFYRPRLGLHMQPSVNFYVGCKAQEQTNLFREPSTTRDMVIVDYPSGGERGLTWAAGDWTIVYN